MIATYVNVYVKPSKIADFINATEENHIDSIKEEGNLRFDVLQDKFDECHFLLYEAYSNEEFSIAHKSTPHYLKWREKVADMMAKPREGIAYNIIYPKKD